LSCQEITYTNDAIDDVDYLFYRLRLPWQEKSYEANVDPPQGALYTVAELKGHMDTAVETDYSATPLAGEKRLLSHTKTLFLENDAVTVLDEGEIESLALPY